MSKKKLNKYDIDDVIFEYDCLMSDKGDWEYSFNQFVNWAGKWIRNKRENHEISLRNMAKQLKISPAYLSDVERGRRPVTKKLLNNLSAIYKEE